MSIKTTSVCREKKAEQILTISAKQGGIMLRIKPLNCFLVGLTAIPDVNQLQVLLQFELVDSFDELYVHECLTGVHRGCDVDYKMAMVEWLWPAAKVPPLQSCLCGRSLSSKYIDRLLRG